MPQWDESMRILLFGRLGDQLGRELEIEAPRSGCTLAELRQLLCSRGAAFRETLGHASVRGCVDQVIVSDDTHVHPGQEVAFIPPLSGG